MLSLPLDVFIVRKLGVPLHDEVAMGAIATGGVVVYNNDIIRDFHIGKETINTVVEKEKKELLRREKCYRQQRPFPDLLGKTVILVDDGIATGATIKVAIKALRLLNPKTIVVAVPVAALSVCEGILSLTESVICPLKPAQFNAVGACYQMFGQTSDDEVTALLKKISD